MTFHFLLFLVISFNIFIGVYIPHIAQHIVEQNTRILHNLQIGKRERTDILINLEGIAIGNGWIDPPNQYWSYITFAYNVGLIDSSQRGELEKLYPICLEEIKNHTDTQSGMEEKLNEKCS